MPDPHPQRVRMQAHSSPDRAYSLTETIAPAGVCVGPHAATQENLHVHVLSGRILVALDATTHDLRPGDHLHLPRNQPRALRVVEDSRLLWLAKPGGIERLAFLLNDPHADPDDVAAVCAAAGVTKLPRSLWNGASPPPQESRPPGPPPAGSGP